MSAITVSKPVAKRLARYYRRNGYVRWLSPERRDELGAQVYKKGDEVRLVAESADELIDIRRLLREAGFKPGRPFRKARQFRQPVYGRDEVARFLELMETVPEPKPKPRVAVARKRRRASAAGPGR